MLLIHGVPNIVGLFLDDFFRFDAAEEPHWLAANNPAFPVALTLRFPRPIAQTRLELTQTSWPTGDYRTADFAADLPEENGGWSEVARNALPDEARASVAVPLPGRSAAALRIRILGTHDRKGARSCGPRRLRLWEGEHSVDFRGATIEATSNYPGHEAASLLAAGDEASPPPAALSVEELRALRPALILPDRRLDLGVTLYRTQLHPRIRAHLDCIDIISLWTWRPADLERLEESLDRIRGLAPGKRILLGCYMWDFDAGRAMPMDLMERQCEIGLRRLLAREIEGIIFLATNLCDLGLEAVEWTRRWIREVGGRPLR